MGMVVMKFGGTSVADPVKIKSAAQKVIAEQQAGNQVVVVVSAMGKATDELEKLAHEITPNPQARAKDLLLSIGEQQTVALMAMAIDDLGSKAFGVSGLQLGIETDSEHTVARIRSIKTDRIRRELDGGKIVVAAGFQGLDKEQKHHDAGPWWQRYDCSRSGCRVARQVRNLHRRQWRIHRRSAACTDCSKGGSHQLQRNAGAGKLGCGSHA